MTRNPDVPEAAVTRLAAYLEALERLETQEVATTSSAEIARHAGVNAAQVRKDLSYFGEFGRPGLGYDVANLRRSLARILHLDREHLVILLGSGRLGTALLGYPGLAQRAFRVAGVFDSSPRVIGQELCGHRVLDVRNLQEFNREHEVKIGIICVPTAQAQAACDQLVAAGIRAILNFAPVSLRAPPHVLVRHVDVTRELQALAYYLAD